MEKTKLKSKGKMTVLLSALIVFGAFTSNSYAKEKKHGAELEIQKKDGQSVRGELLTVKDNSLLVMESGPLSGISVDISDVHKIKILKKSRLLKGLGFGLLIGGGSGALLGFLSGDDPSGWFSMTAGQKALAGGLAFGILGAPIGGIWGAIKGIDESIVLEGRSPEEIKLILKKLNSKSRFPAELPQSFKKTNSIVQKEFQNSIEKAVILKKQIKFKKRYNQKPPSNKFSRVHITFDPGYFNSHGVKDYFEIFKGRGFGDTRPGGAFFIFSSEPKDFPRVAKDPVIYLKDIRLEYSISEKFALGVGYSPLGEHEVHGYKYILISREEGQYFKDLYLLGGYSGSVYYFTGALMPIPDAFLKKSSFKLGAGIGLSSINLNFRTSDWEYTAGKGDNISFSKNSLVLTAFVEYDYYFNRHWSIGLNIDYKYIPVKVEAFQLTGYYAVGYDQEFNTIYSSMIIDFPGERVNFGGFGTGINFGFHF
jgi:hypothetical protein